MEFNMVAPVAAAAVTAFPIIGVASLAISVISSLFGASESKKAEKRALRLGGMNADLILAETAEQKRRLGFEQQQTTATTKTNIAATGFRSGETTMGGSHRTFLKTMKTQQQSEMDWLTQSGTSRAGIARAGGESAASQMRSQTFGHYAKAGESIFGIYSEFKNG